MRYGWLGLLLLSLALMSRADDLESRVEQQLLAGVSVSTLLRTLLAEGQDPQRVAGVVLAQLPWEAPTVAVELATADPAAAPLISAAVAAMALADPAPVAAAVTAAVPALAPEVAASAAQVLPTRAEAVVAAVVAVVPGAAPEIGAAVVLALPDQAAALSAALLETLRAQLPDEFPGLLPLLAESLGRAAPSRLAALSTVLLPAAVEPQARVAVLRRLLEAARVTGVVTGDLTPRVLDMEGATRRRGDASSIRVGQSLPVDDELRVSAGARLVVLGERMVCAALGPATLRWGTVPQLSTGLLRCAGPHIQLAWSAGELSADGADLLLAVGSAGAGMVVFSGPVRVEGGVDLEVGIHQLTAGQSPVSDLAGWLSSLGLEAHPVGDLGEPVVWMAEQLALLLTR